MRPQSTTYTCQTCGTAFYRPPSNTKKSGGRFCSKACYWAYEPTPDEWRERLMAKATINPEPDCWRWHGATNEDGYGMLYHRERSSGRKRRVAAHRLAYELFIGPIPEDMQVLHECDNPACINPRHLFLGTQLDNIVDMVAKGRARGGGRVGTANPAARFTEEEVREMRDLYAQGHGPTALARRYDTHVATVNAIVHRHHWKHVT